jgi:hypothetical protein
MIGILVTLCTSLRQAEASRLWSSGCCLLQRTPHRDSQLVLHTLQSSRALSRNVAHRALDTTVNSYATPHLNRLLFAVC